jgi:transcriptional regulator with XRE-family HTH domain
MTPEEFRAARLKVGLTQQECANVLGYTRLHITGIEAGRKTISAPLELAMQALASGWRPKRWASRVHALTAKREIAPQT